jgi:hypothetical protein
MVKWPNTVTMPSMLAALQLAVMAGRLVSYNMKAADYGVTERGHYGQAQNAYGQADSRADAVRGYQDAHAVTASAQQRQVSIDF